MAARLLRPRWSVAMVMVILATTGLVGSVASRWVDDILFDTDTFMEAVGPIGTGEVVTGAMADKFSSTLIDWIDAEGRLAGMLPDALAPMAGRIADRVDEIVTDETGRFFASDVYEQAWLGLAERAHRAAVALARDQIPFVSTEGGVVTVDLIPVMTPIVDRVFARLTELGQAIPQVILEQVDFDDAIAHAVDIYETEGLPAWLGEIQVYSSDRLAALQETTALLDRLVWVLPVVTVLLAVGALYFAPSRGRMTVVLFGAAGLAWLLASLLVSTLIGTVVGNIESTTAATIADEVFTGITAGLTRTLLILGVVAAVAAVAVGVWLHYSRERDEDKAGAPG
ncbi:MAG: hypothetical protein WCE80_01610 [Acidimicrobiia bacterium]